MTPDQKRIDELETALKVIGIWASVHYDHFYEPYFLADNCKIQRDNLGHIRDKCNEALKK